MQFEESILFLGCDSKIFDIKRSIKSLNNVLLIGNNLVYKGIYDYFELSKHFPKINFHVVGSSNEIINVNSEILNNKLDNVIFHGYLDKTKFISLLKKIDLNILPSRSEGFPKVVLETASAGIPSVLYKDYGAEEWISDGINGFVVNELNDIKSLILKLLSDPDKLKKISKEARALGESYDWKNRISNWEKAFIEIIE